MPKELLYEETRAKQQFQNSTLKGVGAVDLHLGAKML